MDTTTDVYLKRNPPLDQTFQISAIAPYRVDYRERAHIFIWLPTSLTLSIEDYGTGIVPAQQWINIAIKAGTFVFAPLVTSGTATFIVRCTDEVIA